MESSGTDSSNNFFNFLSSGTQSSTPHCSPPSLHQYHPWFFLCGQNNIFAKNNQAFAFDPDSNEWIKLPSTLFHVSISQESSFIGSDGFFFNISANNFSYAPILIPLWRETTPLKFSRLNPLVGVISSEFSTYSVFIHVSYHPSI
ncbi:hypothetical protein LXL04_035496 [Taraxacum kok-saghyz]